MNYSDIERQTFKTFLVFSTLLLTGLLTLFNLSSSFYRVSQILYSENEEINFDSLDSLLGTSIWLIDDYYFEAFYEDNPTVERISIRKDLPNKLSIEISTSDKLVFIKDNRQVPQKTTVLYKNLHLEEKKSNRGLPTLLIENGPVKSGFYEEIVTFIMTLKKYSINLMNIEITYNGEDLFLTHLDMKVSIGNPSDLARKASVIGYYIAENPCSGEIRLTYSQDGNEIQAITNCS